MSLNVLYNKQTIEIEFGAPKDLKIKNQVNPLIRKEITTTNAKNIVQ